MNKPLTTAVAALAAAALIFGGATSANADTKNKIKKEDKAAISVYDKAHAHDDALEAKSKKEAKSNYGQAVKTYEQAVKAWRDTIKKYDAAVKQINKTYETAVALPKSVLKAEKESIEAVYEQALDNADAVFELTTADRSATYLTQLNELEANAEVAYNAATTDEERAAIVAGLETAVAESFAAYLVLVQPEMAVVEESYAAAEAARTEGLAAAQATFTAATATAKAAKDAALADLGKKPAAPVKPTKPKTSKDDKGDKNEKGGKGDKH